MAMDFSTHVKLNWNFSESVYDQARSDPHNRLIIVWGLGGDLARMGSVFTFKRLGNCVLL